MDDADSPSSAPRWTWLVTLGAAVLASFTHLLAGARLEQLTGAFTLVAVVGVLYLLYKWGQERDPSASEDGKSDREREMEAEAGCYGGNAGG